MITVDKISRMQKLNSRYEKLPKIVNGWSLSKRFVPGEGPLDAKVMFIGQAPGKNEDIERRPFIGTSGKFLDRLISISGLERKSIYIVSVVQFFPPKNRIPTKEEIEICKKFLFEQINIVNPKIVVLLGSVACKTVLNLEKVASIHGKVVRKDVRTYFVSMHPAAAVRIRNKIPIMEKDFRKLNQILSKLKI